MQLNLGKKIKTLRKQRNISQEVLAQYLGVTFQAVSKWENETAMPDITLVPAIAAFFGVSTDELLDFNLYEIEKNVEAIVDELKDELRPGDVLITQGAGSVTKVGPRVLENM